MAPRFTSAARERISYSGPFVREVREAIADDIRKASRGRLTNADQVFLTQFVDGMYPMHGLDRLTDLMTDADSRGAFAGPDRWSLFIAGKRRQIALPFKHLSRLETEAVAEIDVLQHDAVTTECPTILGKLASMLPRQIRATQFLLIGAARGAKEASR